MSMTIHYFVSLREQMGHSEVHIEAHAAQTVAEAWETLQGIPLSQNIRAAVNQTYANPNHPARDGNEVAFFPPVTGG